MGEAIGHNAPTRRSFVAGTALAAVAAASLANKGEVFATTKSVAAEPEEQVVWNACSGCGVGKCPLQFHVLDGSITYIEGDTTGNKEFGGEELRACLRGRSQRRWINHPDRLTQPFKRVEGAKRGEGLFEPISWEEAIDLFAEKLGHVIDTYGNEAVFRVSADGTANSGGGLFTRLMNLLGGSLGSYGTDSQTQADFGAGYMLHGAYIPQLSSAWEGSESSHMRDADLIVLFGSSAATSRLSGGNWMYDIVRARENGARFINVDIRQGSEEAGRGEEWLPIRPGTDAALASALCYVFITEGIADEEALRRYCQGYDEESMPESAKGKHLSYKDYIMGTGYDGVPKTPEWASPITQIPVNKIYELAHDIASAKAAFIGAGCGVQRRTNGENATRAIMMIPIVSGQFGLPGTSNGLNKGTAPAGPWIGSYSAGENPIKVQIPITKRIEVIERGEEFTDLRDGLIGGDRLHTSAKFIYARGTNMLVNQNSDVNWAASVLEDETKAEFIVGSDFFMTSSMKYCDLVLPEIMNYEQMHFASTLYAGHMSFMFGSKVQEPPTGCRREFDWLSDVAERFGVREEFTEGMDLDDKVKQAYQGAYDSGYYPGIPTLEEGMAQGWWYQKVESKPALSAFRADPEGSPLDSPSGKIEVYSEPIAHFAETWELDDPRDVISPIPMYNPGYESWEDADDQYPLLLSTWKAKNRYQSKWNQIELLNQANRHQLWINPRDAAERGIESGDMVRVFNDRGELHIEARVTPRIIPGAIAMEHGKMRELDDTGVDVGGCINTLVSHHWSPLAKHNPSNSVLAQVEKL